jgi:hypothetical protein
VAKSRRSLYRAGKRGAVKNPTYWRRESELGAMKRSFAPDVRTSFVSG